MFDSFSSYHIKTPNLNLRLGFVSSRKELILILVTNVSDSGKALEDLRASLFNRFRSPETPKRQQQQQQQHRICGPTVALTFNFVVAISIIFMNKWVILIK